MEPHAFTNLGGNARPEDKRDVKLGAAVLPTYTFVPEIKNNIAWGMQVEYQGQQPACGAHAGGGLQGIKKVSRFSPRYTWADIKTFDGFPIDAGTDMRSIFKSLTGTGALDFNLLGNNVDLALDQYAHLGLTPQMFSLFKQNAATHKGDGYGFGQDTSFNGIKQFINDHGPAILLIQVGPEFWTAPNGVASWLEKDILPLRYPPSVISGHFIVAHSYDENYIYFLNSFGPTWGRAGHGYFGFNYVPRVLEIGTLYPLAFKKDLYLGMTDPDVLRLQQVLNKTGYSQVATSGAGSPGQETTYFGGLTKAMVLKFQQHNGISPQTGYCGPLTRAVINNLA